MSTYITAADLAAFLRTRKSVACNVEGDWVDDHAERAIVWVATERLEALALGAANMVEMRLAACALTRTWPRIGILETTHDRCRQAACLAIVAVSITRPPWMWAGSEGNEPWMRLVEAARHHTTPRLPAWAAVVMRTLGPFLAEDRAYSNIFED